MTKEQLIGKIGDLEWEDFEVKEAKSEVPKSSWETVSAFANTSGGWLVFGVKQNGKQFEIQGVNNGEKIEHDFLSTLRGEKFNVFIGTQQTKYSINGKNILGFYIPASAKKPVYFNTLKNTFIRRGSSDQRATPEEIDAMYRDQTFGTKTAELAPGTSSADLKDRSIEEYRTYMARFNPGVSYNRMQVDEFLVKMRVLDNETGQCTYGGLLFFGKRESVERFFADFRIDLLEIPGVSYEKASSRYTFRLSEDDYENLWEAYFECFKRLRREVDVEFKLSPDGFGEELSPGLQAAREALVNMLMHTDYFAPARPRIRIFTDHLEFYNPGGLPKPLEELREKDLSLPRNPIITKLFRMVRLAENAGYGFDRMDTNWQEYNGNMPEYTISFDSVLIRFRGVEQQVKRQEEWNSQLLDNLGNDVDANIKLLRANYGVFTGYLRGIYGVSADEIMSRFNERLVWVLMILTLSPSITRQQIASILGVSLSTIEKDIRKLRQQNIVNRKGPDKTGEWVILSQ